MTLACYIDLDGKHFTEGWTVGLTGWFISGFALVNMVVLAEKLVKQFEKNRTMEKHH